MNKHRGKNMFKGVNNSPSSNKLMQKVNKVSSKGLFSRNFLEAVRMPKVSLKYAAFGPDEENTEEVNLPLKEFPNINIHV